MSHFSMLVIGDNIDAQLAPFNECHNEGNEQYFRFEPTVDERRKEYATDTTYVFIDPTGKAYSRYNDRFRNPNYNFALFSRDDKTNPREICPDGWTEDDNYPLNKLYATFEEYLVEYCGEDEGVEPEELGYWVNDNAKWDWYVIGGRWANFLTLKDGTKADSARLCDIDFDARRKEKEDFWNEVYNVVSVVIAGTPAHKPWSEYVDFAKKSGEAEIWDKVRKEYHAQERIVALNKLAQSFRDDKTDLGQSIFWNATEMVDEFCLPRDRFLKLMGDRAISTFGILKDGQWIEKGSMGWFGCVSDEIPEESWNNQYMSIIRDLDPNTVVTVVDCHI